LICIKTVACIRDKPAVLPTFKRFQEGNAMHRYALAFIIVASSFSAFAAELPKEGSYDYNSCWSGVSNTIKFSKTHTANSYELTGTNRSNPPGGFLDTTAYRCVGMSASLDGKNTGTNVCEVIDVDGDKRLVHSSTADGKETGTEVGGTGKYEGMVVTGTVEQLGPFPAIKDGTFQGCNHRTGTYKLK
jgi:hypothetical protein